MLGREEGAVRHGASVWGKDISICRHEVTQDSIVHFSEMDCPHCIAIFNGTNTRVYVSGKRVK